MASYISTPSLASATSTNLDSACKHIQQCRVSQDHMMVLAEGDGDDLVRNKYRYCVHKDELVLSIGKPWDQDQKKYNANAYPRVLSNLGKLGDLDSAKEPKEAIKMITYMYHNARSIPERDALLKKFLVADANAFANIPGQATGYFYMNTTSGAFDRMKSAVKHIHDFCATGYANTVGWAHAQTGDTMTSVMIGGLRTVKNGDFEVYCGDMVQWYWPFEKDCFSNDGKRKPIVDPPFSNQNPAAANGGAWPYPREVNMRKRYYDREYGQPAEHPKTVAYIKPYKRDDNNPRLYDWYRVFAVAISSARPHEKVDIRISRQSL